VVLGCDPFSAAGTKLLSCSSASAQSLSFPRAGTRLQSPATAGTRSCPRAVLGRGRVQSFDGLAAPESLRSLVASHNELVSLPDASFVRLASLELLDLSHGCANGTGSETETVSLSGASFVRLASLEQLDLSHNRLEVIQRQAPA